LHAYAYPCSLLLALPGPLKLHTPAR
jgi:hypothetical protein